MHYRSIRLSKSLYALPVSGLQLLNLLRHVGDKARKDQFSLSSSVKQLAEASLHYFLLLEQHFKSLLGQYLVSTNAIK